MSRRFLRVAAPYQMYHSSTFFSEENSDLNSIREFLARGQYPSAIYMIDTCMRLLLCNYCSCSSKAEMPPLIMAVTARI